MDFTPGILKSGRAVVASGGTKVQLSTTSVKTRKVIVSAETDNTGVVVVAGPEVVAAVLTRVGIPLAAGVSITLDISDLNKLWIDAMIDTDGVTYTYMA